MFFPEDEPEIKTNNVERIVKTKLHLGLCVSKWTERCKASIV